MFLLTSHTLSLNLYNNDANFIHFLDSWSPTKQDCLMFITIHSYLRQINIKKKILSCLFYPDNWLDVREI